MDGIFLGVRLEVDARRLEDRGKLFERDDEVDVRAHGAAHRLELFRRARADEDDARVGHPLLDGTRRRDHGRQSARNFVHHVGELRLCEHAPRGAAGGEKEGKLARHDLRRIVVRLGGSPHVRAVRDFEDFLEADVFEGGLDAPQRRLGAELPHDGGRHDGDDLIPAADGAPELEDLRLIGNGAERAAHHALAAAHAFLGIDGSPAQRIARNGLDAARVRAGAHLVGDGVVRAGSLALAALDALLAVDDRSAVLADGDGALGADRHARARHAAAALVAHFIDVVLALIASRGNDLHERGFVIFVGNIARIQPRRDVDGPVLRAERHAEGEAHALGSDGALAVDALAVLRHLRRGDGVRDGLDGAVDVLVIHKICDLGDFDKDLSSQFGDRSIDTSHFTVSLFFSRSRGRGNSPAPAFAFFVTFCRSKR